MKITITILQDECLGNGSGAKAPVKTWQAHPGNFDLAAKAAAHYAKRDNEDVAIVPGNSYGSLCYHLLSPADIGRAIPMPGRFHVAIAKPNGDIFGAVAVLESGKR